MDLGNYLSMKLININPPGLRPYSAWTYRAYDLLVSGFDYDLIDPDDDNISKKVNFYYFQDGLVCDIVEQIKASI